MWTNLLKCVKSEMSNSSPLFPFLLVPFFDSPAWNRAGTTHLPGEVHSQCGECPVAPTFKLHSLKYKELWHTPLLYHIPEKRVTDYSDSVSRKQTGEMSENYLLQLLDWFFIGVLVVNDFPGLLFLILPSVIIMKATRSICTCKSLNVTTACARWFIHFHWYQNLTFIAAALWLLPWGDMFFFFILVWRGTRCSLH